MSNLIMILDGEVATNNFCTTLTPVWSVFGYIIFAIKVVVPIILIVSGMYTMAKAVMEKKEDDIKKAQDLLIKKVIAAVLVFLVVTVTTMIVDLVGSGEWKECAKCALHLPDGNTCYVIKNDPTR